MQVGRPGTEDSCLLHDVVDGNGLAQSLERQIADLFELYRVLDGNSGATCKQDLPVPRHGARPHPAAVAAGPCRRGHRMRRRDLLAFAATAIGASLTAAPTGASDLRRVGFLTSGTQSAFQPGFERFRRRMAELGYSEDT